MDSNLLRQFRQLFDPEKVKSDKKILIFLFFLVLSTIMWVLQALSKEYTTIIDFPVKYINVPSDKVIVGNLPTKLAIKVNSFGYNLASYSISKSFAPVVCDLKSYSLKQLYTNNNYLYFIATDQMNEKVSSQLGQKIKILDFYPDTIFFQFADVVNKTVRIEPNLNIAFDKQYLLKDNIVIDPAFVRITGPNTILDTITFIKTKPLNFRGLNKTIKQKININTINGINYSVENVNITIPVEKYTESSIYVAVKVLNLPKKYKFNIFPNKIKISYFVGLSKFEKVKPSDFLVIVDYKTIVEDKSNKKLRVKLLKYPTFIKNIKFQPQSIDYILEQ